MKEPEIISTDISLEEGRKKTISFNRVVDFELRTKGGTLIRGTLPANEAIHITNGGDIIDFRFITDDIDSSPKLIK
ncbi:MULTISPECIES: hypothetical protein [Providencia]|uniref:hypothetical protein n=1 Tax=Providencia TaxID=586 RepID=UPI001BA5A576|nr:hypothetical protein [Providencia rettgeri]MBS0916394.1 hypothetical protein [Providencia rettgeri]